MTSRQNEKNSEVKKAEIRRDYIQDKYVIIAPKRIKRPHDALAGAAGVFAKGISRSCVFCQESIEKEKILYVWPARRKWKIVVVQNLFPAISIRNPKAYGVQEVVIETRDPTTQLEDMPVSHIAEVIHTYALRTKIISENPKIQYILIFKNSGGPAGATIRHSHSQIFATDFVPPHLLDKSLRVNEYRVRRGRCVYCDTIKRERRGPRHVFEDKNVISFTPYASMHNYEVWILPKRHIDNVTELNASERRSLAGVLKSLLKKISLLGLPYNYYFHQVISDKDQHLYMKITPRGSVWAGVEIGSGVIINPVPPEDAAAYYREPM